MGESLQFGQSTFSVTCCMPSAFRIYPCGDYAITIELGDRIDKEINQKAISLSHLLASQQKEGIKDIIPSYHTVTIVYDLSLLKKNNPAKPIYENMHDWLLQSVKDNSDFTSETRLIKIPVCYDILLVSDIAFIAEQHGLSVDDVINIHTSKTYRVYLVGFLPGFAYMGSVDNRIATPRKSSPRISVPAGSVGIAGEQTGIYPFDSPGGWQIVGQTPLQVFNVNDQLPCLLNPGDEVQFYSISMEEFKNIKANGHPHS